MNPGTWMRGRSSQVILHNWCDVFVNQNQFQLPSLDNSLTPKSVLKICEHSEVQRKVVVILILVMTGSQNSGNQYSFQAWSKHLRKTPSHFKPGRTRLVFPVFPGSAKRAKPGPVYATDAAKGIRENPYWGFHWLHLMVNGHVGPAWLKEVCNNPEKASGFIIIIIIIIILVILILHQVNLSHSSDSNGLPYSQPSKLCSPKA